MHKFLKKYLVWFPLMLLIALPCSAKRELKVIMNVVHSEQVNFSKGETVKLCVDGFAQAPSTKESYTYQNLHPTLRFNHIGYFSFFYQSTSWIVLPDLLGIEHLPVAIFILHRKLII